MDANWNLLFTFTVPPLELFVRGSIIYLFLFAVFRTVLQRDIGAVGVADVLVLVLVADAAQNAMAAEYRSVSDGLVLISTILGWNLLFDYLAYRFPALRRLLEPPEICLVRNGRIQHRNLRREFLSVDDLHAKLREHGIADLAEVRMACMESDGTVSVIRRHPGKTEEEAALLRRSPPK
ncbi:MAG TPA: YetF domain-containing protein [Azonexus sp.]